MVLEEIIDELEDKTIEVYFDLENEAVAKTEKGLAKLDELENLINSRGLIVNKSVFADYRLISNKVALQLHSLGYDAKQIPHGIKNDVDFEMSFDIMESLCGNDIDLYIIISSDTDFLSICRRIKTHKKEVMLITWSSEVHDRFKLICDHVISLAQGEIPEGLVKFEDMRELLVSVLESTNGQGLYISELGQEFINREPRYNGPRSIFKNGVTPYNKLKKFLMDPDLADIIELIGKEARMRIKLR